MRPRRRIAAGRGVAPHVHRFQIAVLELERGRRRHEQAALRDRLARIEERLREIAAEIAARQRACET